MREVVAGDEQFPDNNFEDLDHQYDDLRIRESLDILMSIEDNEEVSTRSKELFSQESLITFGRPMYVGEIGRKKKASRTYFSPEYVLNEKSIRILEREGLASVVNQKFTSSESVFSLMYFRATTLGVSLIARCYPKESEG